MIGCKDLKGEPGLETLGETPFDLAAFSELKLDNFRTLGVPLILALGRNGGGDRGEGGGRFNGEPGLDGGWLRVEVLPAL